MRLSIFLSLSIIVSMVTSSTCSAEVYRWVDKNGKTHFSDKPLDKNAETVTIKQQPKLDAGNPAASPPPGSAEKLLNAYSDRRKLKNSNRQNSNSKNNR